MDAGEEDNIDAGDIGDVDVGDIDGIDVDVDFETVVTDGDANAGGGAAAAPAAAAGADSSDDDDIQFVQRKSGGKASAAPTDGSSEEGGAQFVKRKDKKDKKDKKHKKDKKDKKDRKERSQSKGRKGREAEAEAPAAQKRKRSFVVNSDEEGDSPTAAAAAAPATKRRRSGVEDDEGEEGEVGGAAAEAPPGGAAPPPGPAPHPPRPALDAAPLTAKGQEISAAAAAGGFPAPSAPARSGAPGSMPTSAAPVSGMPSSAVPGEEPLEQSTEQLEAQLRKLTERLAAHDEQYKAELQEKAFDMDESMRRAFIKMKKKEKKGMIRRVEKLRGQLGGAAGAAGGVASSSIPQPHDPAADDDGAHDFYAPLGHETQRSMAPSQRLQGGASQSHAPLSASHTTRRGGDSTHLPPPIPSSAPGASHPGSAALSATEDPLLPPSRATATSMSLDPQRTGAQTPAAAARSDEPQDYSTLLQRVAPIRCTVDWHDKRRQYEQQAMEILGKMEEARKADLELMRRGKPAARKVALLTEVVAVCGRANLQRLLVEKGLLKAFGLWLKAPAGELPTFKIRVALVRVLLGMPYENEPGRMRTKLEATAWVGVSKDDLMRAKELGHAVKIMAQHPDETSENTILANRLMERWSRCLFNLSRNYKELAREEASKGRQPGWQPEPYIHVTEIQRYNVHGQEVHANTTADGQPMPTRCRLPARMDADFVRRPERDPVMPLQKAPQYRAMEKNIRAYKAKTHKAGASSSEGGRMHVISIEGSLSTAKAEDYTLRPAAGPGALDPADL